MRDRHRVCVVRVREGKRSQQVKLETDRVSHQRTQVEGLRIVDHHLGDTTTKWAGDGVGRLTQGGDSEWSDLIKTEVGSHRGKLSRALQLRIVITLGV
jgi:hypothetical protein